MNERSPTIRGIAHDLNNQIMVVLNSLDQLARIYPDASELEIAFKAVEQCAVLTAQLYPGGAPVTPLH